MTKRDLTILAAGIVVGAAIGLGHASADQGIYPRMANALERMARAQEDTARNIERLGRCR